MKKTLLIIFFNIAFLSLLLTLCQAKVINISKEQAFKIATNTAEVQSFLKYYGECKGCNPSYSIGKINLIGCTEYKIKKNDPKNEWEITYWVSKACSFKYGDPESTKIHISVNMTGDVTAKTPKLEYIKNQLYCQNDSDCLCRSGSGTPFIGCMNSLHGPSSWAGAYKCEKCRCSNNACS